MGDTAEIPVLAFRGQLDAKLEEAMLNGSFMVGVWWFNGDQVKFWRKTVDFPITDFSTAVDLLDADLKGERDRLNTAPVEPPVEANGEE